MFDIAAASLTDLQREITRVARIERLDNDAHVIVSAGLQRTALKTERHARLVAIAAQRGNLAATLCGLSLTDLFRAAFNRPTQTERDMARDLMTSRMVELGRHVRHYATA